MGESTPTECVNAAVRQWSRTPRRHQQYSMSSVPRAEENRFAEHARGQSGGNSESLCTTDVGKDSLLQPLSPQRREGPLLRERFGMQFRAVTVEDNLTKSKKHRNIHFQ